MKQLTLILVFVFALSSAFAQKRKVSDAQKKIKSGELVKAEESLQLAYDHKKTKNWAKTYLVKGNMYQAMYQYHARNLAPGMLVMMVEKSLGKPKSKEAIEGAENWVYDNITLTMANGVLQKWKETKAYHENPLPLAWKAYQKARELDAADGNGFKKDIDKEVMRLVANMQNQGIDLYYRPEYANALVSFELSLKVSKTLEMNNATIAYYAGLAASRAKNYEKAIEMYDLSIDTHDTMVDKDISPADAMHWKSEAYKSMKNSNKQIAVIKDAFEKFPNNQQIMIDLINYYMTAQQTEKALEYLDIAIKKDPKNAAMVFAKASLYDKTGVSYNKNVDSLLDVVEKNRKLAFKHRNDPAKAKPYKNAEKKADKEAKELIKKSDENLNKAIANYTKVTELDPKHFDGHYFIALIHYNKAMNIKREADGIRPSTDPDGSKYKKKTAEMKAKLNEALPEAEILYELNPKDVYGLTLLKNIYFNLGQRKKAKEIAAQIKP